MSDHDSNVSDNDSNGLPSGVNMGWGPVAWEQLLGLRPSPCGGPSEEGGVCAMGPNPTGQAVRVMVRHVRVMVRHVYIVPSESSHVEYP